MILEHSCVLQWHNKTLFIFSALFVRVQLLWMFSLSKTPLDVPGLGVVINLCSFCILMHTSFLLQIWNCSRDEGIGAYNHWIDFLHTILLLTSALLIVSLYNMHLWVKFSEKMFENLSLVFPFSLLLSSLNDAYQFGWRVPFNVGYQLLILLSSSFCILIRMCWEFDKWGMDFPCLLRSNAIFWGVYQLTIVLKMFWEKFSLMPLKQIYWLHLVKTTIYFALKNLLM